jgi:hypothetical protein
MYTGRFHFHENVRVSATADDIEFTQRTAPISLNYLIAAVMQVISRGLFALGSYLRIGWQRSAIARPPSFEEVPEHL